MKEKPSILKILAYFLLQVIIVLFIGGIGAVAYLNSKPEVVAAAPAGRFGENEGLSNRLQALRKEEMMLNKGSKDIGGSLDLTAELILATATETPGELQQSEDKFLQDWSSFMRRWLSSMDGAEWIYFSYRAELSGELGKDPFSEWMLPNNSLNEHWFKVDQNQNVNTELFRRTDLIRGNVWYGSWKDGVIVLNYPDHVEKIEDENHRSLVQSIDPACASFAQPERIVSLDLIEGDRTVYQATLSVIYENPQESGGPIEGIFNGMEIVCANDLETGAPIIIEQTLIAENGERSVLARFYDYEIVRDPVIPAEVLALLENR